MLVFKHGIQGRCICRHEATRMTLAFIFMYLLVFQSRTDFSFEQIYLRNLKSGLQWDNSVLNLFSRQKCWISLCRIYLFGLMNEKNTCQWKFIYYLVALPSQILSKTFKLCQIQHTHIWYMISHFGCVKFFSLCCRELKINYLWVGLRNKKKSFFFVQCLTLSQSDITKLLFCNYYYITKISR